MEIPGKPDHGSWCRSFWRSCDWGDATGDQLIGIENLTGSANADELKGSNITNIINAGAGDDWIDFTAGTDTYNGGDGFDTIDYSISPFVSGTTTYHTHLPYFPYTSDKLIKGLPLSTGSAAANSRLVGQAIRPVGCHSNPAAYRWDRKEGGGASEAALAGSGASSNRSRPPRDSAAQSSHQRPTARPSNVIART